MIPAELLFQTNIEGVSVGVAMEEKKFCPAGTSGGLIKWRHLLTTCRVAIKKMVTDYTWFPLQGKEEEQGQNILGWEEKSKQPITAFFDFANLPCPEGETLKSSVDTSIVSVQGIAMCCCARWLSR